MPPLIPLCKLRRQDSQITDNFQWRNGIRCIVNRNKQIFQRICDAEFGEGRRGGGGRSEFFERLVDFGHSADGLERGVEVTGVAEVDETRGFVGFNAFIPYIFH